MPRTMPAGTVFDFEAESIDGRPVSLGDLRGHVLLVVNVASACGFTPQYRALEAVHRRHRAERFAVLGFPCDQFGHQEPGTNADIRAFCAREYDVTFPLFAKVKVNGPEAHPLFAFLTRSRAGWLGSRAIKWNFTKFLVARSGQVLARYGSARRPETIEHDIVRALADPVAPPPGAP